MKFKLYPPQFIYELGQRDNQEDSIYPLAGVATPADRLFIVCDGMGGHEHGEVASRAVAETISNYIVNHHSDGAFADEMLLQAINAAYMRLDELDTGAARKMGTTLTFLYMHQGGVTVAHIGDSRIYHLRPASGEILYESRDHSLVMDLYQAGEISKSQMRTSPQKNIITRAMSPGEDNRCRADIVHIANVNPGDYFYLCSDGMLENMEGDELLELLSQPVSDEEKRQKLITATASNKDNHSAYLIHVQDVVSEEHDVDMIDDEATSRFNAINIYRRREAEDAQDVIVVEASSTPCHNSDVSVVSTPQNPQQNPMNTPKKSRRFPFLLVGLLAICILAAGYFFLNGQKFSMVTSKDPNKSGTEQLKDNGKNRPVADSDKGQRNQRVVEPKAPAQSQDGYKPVEKRQHADENAPKSQKPDGGKIQQKIQNKMKGQEPKPSEDSTPKDTTHSA